MVKIILDYYQFCHKRGPKTYQNVINDNQKCPERDIVASIILGSYQSSLQRGPRFSQNVTKEVQKSPKRDIVE